MHIIHLTWSLQLGGLETMLVNIINEQICKEQVSLIIINDSNDDTLVKKIDSRIKTYFLNRRIKSHNPFPYLKLNLLLLKINPTVIHCHAPRIGMVLLPIFRKKVLWTIHDVNIEKKYFTYFSHYCSISKCVYNNIKSRLNIESNIIYNGIKISDFKEKTTLKRNSDIFKIVQVSRLIHEKKGQHILIKAIKLLKDKGYTNIYADFVGEGKSYNYLKHLIEEYNLCDNVKLIGAQNNSWVAEHLSDYDLVCQPSIFEGFGLTVAEGMASKVPVLVSANEGPMEIIDDGKYGYCFQNGNIEDCASKIESIIKSDNTDLVKAAYKHIYENFNIEKTAKNYIDEYKKFQKYEKNSILSSSSI